MLNQKILIDVEVVGIEEAIKLTEILTEKAEELLSVADDLTELDKQNSVFELNLGTDFKFKGTKSDFVTAIDGMTVMAQRMALINK